MASRKANAAKRARKQEEIGATLPAVKMWVLVRPANVRLWKNAVPAMVSKVADTLNGKRVNVVMPISLVLGCGFAGKPFHELKDLTLSDIRLYQGSVRERLAEALTQAVMQAAQARATVKSKAGPAQVSPAPRAPPVASPPGQGATSEPSPASPAVAPLPTPGTPEERHTTKDNIAALFQGGRNVRAAPDSPARVAENKELRTPDVRMEERHTTKENVAALFRGGGSAQAAPATGARAAETTERLTSESSMDERGATKENSVVLSHNDGKVSSVPPAGTLAPVAGDAAPVPPAEATEPATPRRRSKRKLEREDTPPDPAPVASDAAPVALSKLQLAEFTKVIASAFRKTREAVLTRQEVAVALEKSAELAEGLRQLDATNKVFLSDDLVFLV